MIFHTARALLFAVSFAVASGLTLSAGIAAPDRLSTMAVDRLDNPMATPAATVSPAITPEPTRTTATKIVSGRTGSVVLLRGWMDVFSYGMDALGGLLQEKGFTAEVMNHSSWQKTADALVERYKSTRSPEPVFLIGHSLGADAIILMSERLGREGVPVALAVTFDPVHPRPIPANVRKMFNFYQSNNGWGAPLVPGPNFKATLVNTDLKDRTDIGHTSIDKADFLHSKVVDEMMKLSRPVKRRVAG